MRNFDTELSQRNNLYPVILGFPMGRHELDPWWVGSVGILWRRAWQPTPVFLPGESHGQRNLVG